MPGGEYPPIPVNIVTLILWPLQAHSGPVPAQLGSFLSVPWARLLLQETVDMLKTHIKEELMQGEEADGVYESMAHLSTDLLMKCSLNPGCDDELYESMAAFAPAATEDLCE